jgi:hypothetical protein
MANVLICFILVFRELIWKPRYEKINLWKQKSDISRVKKTTLTFIIIRVNLNSLMEKKEDGKHKNRQTDYYKESYISTSTPPPLQIKRTDRLQKSVLLQKKSMDNFVKKYIYKDWIPIKKIYNKIRLYIAKELN